MKKRFFGILIALSFVLAIVLAPAVYADEYISVIDGADALTSDECAELNNRAIDISIKHDCDVTIIFIDMMTDDDPIELWAEYFYERCDFGWGPDKSGVLFFISVIDRDMTILAHGYGNTAFTDHGKDVMLDNYLVPLMKNDEYYKACSKYLDLADEYLGLARSGAPFDVDTDEEYLAEKAKGAFGTKVALTIIIPLLVSLIICMVWRGQMKTARKARQADNYIPEGGFNLTRYEDLFIYRTQTRTRIESSSGGSGGTSINSRGYSSSSRKF